MRLLLTAYGLSASYSRQVYELKVSEAVFNANVSLNRQSVLRGCALLLLKLPGMEYALLKLV